MKASLLPALRCDTAWMKLRSTSPWMMFKNAKGTNSYRLSFRDQSRKLNLYEFVPFAFLNIIQGDVDRSFIHAVSQRKAGSRLAFIGHVELKVCLAVCSVDLGHGQRHAAKRPASAITDERFEWNAEVLTDKAAFAGQQAVFVRQTVLTVEDQFKRPRSQHQRLNRLVPRGRLRFNLALRPRGARSNRSQTNSADLEKAPPGNLIQVIWHVCVRAVSGILRRRASELLSCGPCC